MMTKILIVDDEENILEEASEALTEQGYECFIASSVEAAIEIIKKTPEIMLILTDLMMPKMTGADLINRVEAMFGKDIKFLLMSGHSSFTSKESGVELDSYHYIRKPLNIEDMLEKIAFVLGNN